MPQDISDSIDTVIVRDEKGDCNDLQRDKVSAFPPRQVILTDQSDTVNHTRLDDDQDGTVVLLAVDRNTWAGLAERTESDPGMQGELSLFERPVR